MQKIAGIAGILAFLVAGCCASKTETMNSMAPGVKKAVAVLTPASASQVHGTVTFTQAADGILVSADLNGLTPGKHGFHIHEYGDCSSPEAKSAGGHFNPEGMQHGGPEMAMHHAGDIGNIEADAQGHAVLQFTDKSISFSGKDSILGRAVIVHAKEDDLKSQPAGNAGDRVACGVIGAAAQ